MIVVLPSSFTGGAAHLSHAGQSMVIDSSSDSLLKTTVMAWYTDVTHEIKPVTGGHRLALSYNLIHTTASLRPALSHDGEFLQTVRPILRSWQQDGGKSAPEKLLYLLKHQYSQANLCASALKGADAQTVALLATVVEEFGFHLGLATITCYVRGCSNEDVPDISISDYEIDLEKFVDLDGTLLSKKLDFCSRESIPKDLTEGVDKAEYYNEQRERYTGNVSSLVPPFHVPRTNYQSIQDGGLLERCKYR